MYPRRSTPETLPNAPGHSHPPFSHKKVNFLHTPHPPSTPPLTNRPPTHTARVFLSSPQNTHFASRTSQPSPPQSATFPLPPFPSSPTSGPRSTSCASHSIPTSKPPTLISNPKAFAPARVAIHSSSSTPNLRLSLALSVVEGGQSAVRNLDTPPASLAACRMLGLYPPLISVPRETVMPSSSSSLTGQIPLPM